MACPRKTTGASSNGFGCANKGDGTSNWMPTPLRASSISYLTKLKVNRRRAFFVNGRLKSEIRRHSAILGTLPGVALRRRNPHYPSLRFRCLQGSEDCFSIRIGDHYRALGRRAGEKMIWVWIGTHSDYDRLVGS